MPDPEKPKENYVDERIQNQIIHLIRSAQRIGIQVHGVLFVGDQEPIYPGTCRDDIDRERP